MIPTQFPKQLEQQWIKFQFDIAGLRGVLGPMYQAAVDARRAHTFHYGDQPGTRIVRAMMQAAPGEPNGVPDGHAIMTGATYGARVTSVMAASLILMTFDTAIQEFAGRLGAALGANMNSGDLTSGASNDLSERSSTLIWAAANNIRHVEEWNRTAMAYRSPLTQGDRRLREMQNRSMEPLARVIGCALPIVDNVAFEVFQLLTEGPPLQGSYDRLELHVLRIGQDLVTRAGLTNAQIGVTITETLPSETIATIRAEDLTISDGVAKTASSLPDTERLANLRPALEPLGEPEG